METTGLYPSTSFDWINLRTRSLAIKERVRWSSVLQSASVPCCSPPSHAGAVEECRTEDITFCYASPSCADITACTSEAILSLSRSFSKAKLPPVEAVPILELVPKRSGFQLLTSVEPVFPNLEPRDAQSYLPHIPSFVSSIKPAIDSYDLLGNLGDGTHGEVMLASLKGIQNGELFAVKILHKTSDEIEERGNLQETSTLQMILEASSLPRAGTTGVQFLQKLRRSFLNEESVQCLVLEYHPLTLSNPEVASFFLLTPDACDRIPASPSLPAAFHQYLAPQRPQGEVVQSVRLLAAEISLGLAFLHDRGLIHQDIKPANIFISYAGHIVIGDFGATSKMPLSSGSGARDQWRHQAGHYGAVVLDSNDVVTFTPIYAAPELKERTPEGLIVYDNRSDWWSLGILLYEMVTGTLPFLDASAHGYTCGQRRSDGDRSLNFGELKMFSDRQRRRNSGWLPGLESFLVSLLSRSPEDRLGWPDMKGHEFLYPLCELWKEIADLKHPPCPDLLMSRANSRDSFRGKDDEEINLVVQAEAISTPLSEASDTQHHNKASFECLFNPSLQPSLIPKQLQPYQSSFLVHGDSGDSGDSDKASIPQAWPSSASIWNFSNIRQQMVDSISDIINSHDKHSHIFDASIRLGSPFSPTPVPHSDRPESICGDLHRSPTLNLAGSLEVCDDPIDPEQLTWSLLEAMDERDRLQVKTTPPQQRVLTRRQGYLGLFKRLFRFSG